MKSLRPYVRERGRALGLASAVGVGLHLATPAPPPRTLDGLAGMLGAATNGVVLPAEIAWEKSPGFLSETFVGRSVLFLAAKERGKPRDLYRARVRVTLSGQPIAVTQLHNLTETPLGDEVALDIAGSTAVFATLAFGRIQGISVLDVSGIPAADKSGTLLDSALLGVTSFRKTGSFVGLGRTDITLDVPAKEVKMHLEPPVLAIDLGERGRELNYDLRTRTLRGPGGVQAYAARAVPQVYASKPLVLWAVDTVRDQIGPEPIAWLENRVFGAKDTVKRTAYALFSSPSEATLKAKPDGVVAAKVLDASKLTSKDLGWPPPPVPSLWQNPKPNEGQWQPVTDPFLKPPVGVVETPQSKRPAYFYTTYIRPDVKRPYAEVMLIAMDMRQLELGMQAGYEDPKPLTGPPGGGRLPEDEAVLSRVVGTFNGAFKTTHGEYGMMVDRRVLLPPKPEAASVVVTESGEVGLGSWPKDTRVPDEFVAYRQNLDPLLEDGVLNPAGRNIWGWQLEGTSVMTQRTALCLTSAGHLYYAFGEEIDGPTLAKAMRQAGCSYAIHLDMNPNHCGFVFADVVNNKRSEFNLRVAHPEMKIRPDKFVRWSPKDFFYVTVRELTRDASGLRWVPDGGQQPPPEWLPGILKTSVPLGSEQVELISFEKGRTEWRVRAGTHEPGKPELLKRTLGEEDAHSVMAAIGLGHTTDATRYGLAFGAAAPHELRGVYATLVLTPGKPPVVHGPGYKISISAEQEAVQLPLLAEDGQLTPRARERGSMRDRAALCVTANERVVVGRVYHDSSDGLANTLVRAGCKRILELDRGSHHPAFVHRTGSSTPPMTGYETTVLYAVGRPMLPHAFRWAAAQPVQAKATALSARAD